MSKSIYSTNFGDTVNADAGYNFVQGQNGDDNLFGQGGDATQNGAFGQGQFTGDASQNAIALSGPALGAKSTITEFVSNVTAPGSADILLIPVTGSSGLWIGDVAFDGCEPQVRFDDTLEIAGVDSNGNGSSNFSFVLTGVSQAGQLMVAWFLFT